jgi:hypothetical protein
MPPRERIKNGCECVPQPFRSAQISSKLRTRLQIQPVSRRTYTRVRLDRGTKLKNKGGVGSQVNHTDYDKPEMEYGSRVWFGFENPVGLGGDLSKRIPESQLEWKNITTFSTGEIILWVSV